MQHFKYILLCVTVVVSCMPTLCQSVIQSLFMLTLSVMKSQKTWEVDVLRAVGKVLKCAPDRCGGGGPKVCI
jgi:pyrroline-5-carboxylate reductase